tara:strand:+ start:501 stop:833 length:333 start_codon:yes stop_codon:yes gene_type:complete
MTSETTNRPDFWTKDERENSKENYCCEILISNGTFEQVSSREFPTDACIIKYCVDNAVCYDLTRGSQLKLFDMYYDKFKKGLKKIDYGKGTISPKLWGYKPQNNKKKKRS